MNTFFRGLAPLALVVGAIGALGVAITPSAVLATEVAETGQFRGADSSHPAEGTAEVVRLSGGRYGIKLHGDFAVRAGPDLRVYLSDAGNPRSAGAVRSAEYVDLGALRSANGEQVYTIPASANLGNASSVVIWCREFGVLFGTAPLG